MKKLLVCLFTLFSIVSSQAAEVRGARIDGDKLLVDVSYGGGCGEHLFDLEIGGCDEKMPVQCQAELVHVTDDVCEKSISRTVEFSLTEKGLDDSYFRNGRLTISGDRSWQTGERSQATVIIK